MPEDTITRRELVAIRELMDVRFQSIQRALEVAKHEADAKNVELNDVRYRFIPREVFEEYKSEQSKRLRGTLVTLVLMGLTIVGLMFSLLVELRK